MLIGLVGRLWGVYPISVFITADYNDYKKVRINEINADTPGFTDKGEFVELIGTPRVFLFI